MAISATGLLISRFQLFGRIEMPEICEFLPSRDSHCLANESLALTQSRWLKNQAGPSARALPPGQW